MNLSIIKQIMLLRRNLLITLAVIFCINLAVQLFITFYSKPELEKLRTAWLKQQETAGRGAALHDREILYKKGLADLAKFHERLYLKSQFARFLSELYNLAATNKLEIASLSYKYTLNKEEQILEYQLDLAVKGNYSQLKKFINDLGFVTNILVIDSISLSSTGTSADTVQLQIKITSYFRMEGQ